MCLGALGEIKCGIWFFWIGNALAKSGEAAKAASVAKVSPATKVASEGSAVTHLDEQLSTTEMELRMKLLRENR